MQGIWLCLSECFGRERQGARAGAERVISKQTPGAAEEAQGGPGAG